MSKTEKIWKRVVLIFGSITIGLAIYFGQLSYYEHQEKEAIKKLQRSMETIDLEIESKIK